MQGPVGVAQDRVPLIDLLHHVRVQAVLLEKNRAVSESPQAYRKKRTYM